MKKYVTVILKIFSFLRATSKPSPSFSLAKIMDFLPFNFSYLSVSLSKRHKNEHTKKSNIIYKNPNFNMQKTFHHLMLAENRGIIKCLLSSTGAF